MVGVTAGASTPNLLSGKSVKDSKNYSQKNMEKFTLPNVLADRYASSSMVSLWSPIGKVIMEREFWIAVMKAQKELGIKIDKNQLISRKRLKVGRFGIHSERK